MPIKTIRQIEDIKNKRVLLRVDFNVDIGTYFIVDKTQDYRLVKTLPTIKYLMKKGAKIIIMAHLGRPNGAVVEKMRLDPIAVRLSQLLKKDIYKSDKILGFEVERKISEMKAGDILMLENIRFDSREKKGDKDFAKKLAKLGDIFVNDAFAVCHRDHASVSVIQNYLPSYGGLLLEREIVELNKVVNNPKKPLVCIIGGAKIFTKIKLINKFLKLADYVLLGGALANTVLASKGVSVGKSVIEKDMIGEIKNIKLTENKLRVPLDGLMAKNISAKKGRLDALADVKKNEYILDIGPETIKLYKKIISQAKMVLWNGPMGMIENPAFEVGTSELIKILANSCAHTVVGGGETVTVIRKMGLENKFNFISTGGGAMLEYLKGSKLPGLKSLMLND